MLVSLATTGCPRTFSVHIDTAEMTRAKPIFARIDPSEQKDPRVRLTTTKGVEFSVDRARLLRWLGDDGSLVNGDELGSTTRSLTSPDKSVSPFYPPRGGTWTFQVPDDTTLSRIGKYTTITGGVGVGLMAVGIFFTAAIIGPEPTFNVDKTFRTEGLILLGPVAVATVGGILWAAGNLAFKHQPDHLGEGTYQFARPRSDVTRTRPASGGYFGGL